MGVVMADGPAPVARPPSFLGWGYCSTRGAGNLSKHGRRVKIFLFFWDFWDKWFICGGSFDAFWTNGVRGNGLFHRPTAFGDTIFLRVKKDSGERHAKGVATPFDPPGVNRDLRGDVLASYEFALVQLTRLGPSVACGKHTVSTDSCVLRPDGGAKRRRRKCPWGTRTAANA